MTDDEDIPPVIVAWVKQLLDPQFVALIKVAPTDRIDVRLSAAKGNVARTPQIILNAGPQDMIPV